MSNATTKKTSKVIRYTDAQKKEVVDFVSSYNATNGRGGQSKAAEKFKISPITVGSWLNPKGASGSKTPKKPKAAQAPKAAKTPKAAKAPKAAKTPKVAKSSGGKTAAKRYTQEQKKEVTDFVVTYNAANGRGGQSKAAEKFKISPLTVMAWLKASGGKTKAKKGNAKGAKAPKASKSSRSTASSSFDNKLTSLLALSKEISQAEAALAKLNAKFSTLKASL